MNPAPPVTRIWPFNFYFNTVLLGLSHRVGSKQPTCGRGSSCIEHFLYRDQAPISGIDVQGWGLIRLVQGQKCDFLFCVSGFQVFCIVRLFISAADGWRGCSTLLRAVLTMRSWIWSRWQAWGWIAAYIVRDDRSVLSSRVPADKNRLCFLRSRVALVDHVIFQCIRRLEFLFLEGRVQLLKCLYAFFVLWKTF